MKNLLTAIGLFMVLTKGYAFYHECNEMKRSGLPQTETKRNASYHPLNN
ncbi:Natural resistance-associated macrophage protein 1 [Pseudomonas chlororaphis subsp. aurantiaca]|nr:hypothetical protein [Pseudomonas chlororaphis]BAV72854.1 Natural resistance-associated macrophage protein 1 [Pseudomonas chlororaphis subsp. aurantiaca]